MGGLFRQKQNTTNTTPKVSSLQVQTSCLGKPEPWIFGTNRIPPNIIQYDNFQAHPRTEGGGGGKGGQKQSGTTSYSYTVAIIMALCSGQIASIGKCWKGKEQTNLANLKLDLYTGSNTQTPHPFWLSNYPDKALSYRNTAYLAGASYDLGDNATLDNHSFEVKTLTNINASILDANIKDIIVTILTDKQKGVGLEANQIGDLTAFNNFCLANGLWLSPIYQEQEPAFELIKTLLEIGYSDCIYSDGIFKIIPYSDVDAFGSYANYIANRQSTYSLNEDDFIDNGLDTVIVTRKSISEAYNHVSIKYRDRSNDYNDAIIEAKDQADIEQYGLKTLEVIDLPMICEASVAQKVADFKLQRFLSIRNEYIFSLPIKYILLEPLDIVTLTYEALGLVNVPVLITEIEEQDNILNIKAEQYPSGTTKASIQPVAPSSGYTPDFAVNPGNANIPILFEPPLSLTNGEPQLWLATAGGANWGGCQVWVSIDNVNYSNIGTLNQPSRYGSLYQALNAGAIIDSANQLFVDFTASRAVINNTSHLDAENLSTLSYVDGEYLAFADTLLTGLNKYRLSYLVRGAYGSDITPHNIGTNFVRLDENIFKYTYLKDWIGKQIYIKLLSFNQFNNSTQSLSEVIATTYTLQGASLPPPKNIRFEKAWTGQDAMLAWDSVDGAISYEVEVVAGSPASAKRNIVNLTNPKYTYTVDQMLLDGGPYRTIIFKVRAKSITGKLSQWVQINASNPQIGALTGISVDGGMGTAFIKYTQPSENDFAGVQVWISTTSPVTTNNSNLVYDGPANLITINKLANGDLLTNANTYYLKIAGYDSFGKDNLNYSSEISFSVQSLVLGENSITQTMIADGAISTPKLAANSVTADKILVNSITGDKLLANSITGDKIQANTITSNHIQAGSIQADDLQVGFGANILEDSAFESNLQFWNTESSGNVSFVFNETQINGGWYVDHPSHKTLQILRAVAPYNNYYGSLVSKNFIAVNSNDTYIFSVYAQAHRCKAQIGYYCYDINKNLIGSNLASSENATNYQIINSNDLDGKSLESYHRLWRKFKLPTNVKFIKVVLVNNGNDSGANAGAYFFRPKLEQALANQAQPSPWDSAGSTVIGAGSVKTDKLSAITANLGFINATDGININNKFIVGADGSMTIQNSATGQRLVITNSLISIYDSNGILRVRMGIW